MTLFEALKFNREPLEKLLRLGVKPDDIRYIDLYSEFEEMKGREREDDIRRAVFGR